ncbi:PKD domain-containing protein [Methanoregula sp.]|uniref:PKD domain-containing protein n=5 Tax=Methanoregula sp. TaxID=2052170 RepID=UPI003FD78500
MKKIVLVILLLLIGIVHVVGAGVIVSSFTATPTSGTAPLTVHFTDTTTGNPVRWQWNFGPGAYSTLQNPTYVYNNYGTYQVTLETTDSNSSTIQSPSLPMTITVNGIPFPPPTFTMTPNSGTLPLTVTFSDTSTVPAMDRAWYPFIGGGTLGNIPNPTYTHTITAGEYCQYNNNGVISVTLQDWNNSYDPSTASSTQNIIIQVPPNPTSSFTATPTSGPAPLSVDFIDTSLNNPTIWSWNFGDGTGSNQKNPSHNYTISGVYTVTMQASSSTTCNPTNPASSTITVFSPLAPGTTTSPTLAPTQTATATSSTLPTTTVTGQTTAPVGTSTQTVTATPTGSYFTPKPTVTTTQKVFTLIPTVTPTPKSPLGIEFSILAICIGILIIQRQS